jgi:uncharacterized membrane protein YphA (DoxX/SURF4 family)
MKMRNIMYWIATGLTAAAFVLGGVVDIGRGPQVAEGMKQLGYPLYLALILGVWKVLGALAIVAPRLPLLKEWAYAGIFFDLTGASASHALSHDTAGHILTPLILLVIVAISWALRPPSRRLVCFSERPASPGTAPLEAAPLSGS